MKQRLPIAHYVLNFFMTVVSFNVLDGTVIGHWAIRHRHQAFIRFLSIIHDADADEPSSARAKRDGSYHFRLGDAHHRPLTKSPAPRTACPVDANQATKRATVLGI
jgi:hypothetical protein